MFYYLHISCCLLRRRGTPSFVSLYYALEKNPWRWRSSYARYLSTNSKEHSFPVTYLIQTLGFSPESAILASKYMNFKTSDNPNSVLAFLKEHGFSHTQISKLVRNFPQLLIINPLKTLLPKLDFLYSKGASVSDVVQIVTKDPILLGTSLDKKLIPSYNFLITLFKSEQETLFALKRSGLILRLGPDDPSACNLKVLRECGVPNAKILNLFSIHPRAVNIRTDRFKDNVEEVKKLGFNPKTSKFVVALYLLNTYNQLFWEKKVDVYRQSGWSEQEFLSAFRRHPWCMAISEDKIIAVMDFFRVEMDLEPSVIAKHPVVLSLSLKRMALRASVAQVLVSEGLLKKEFNLTKVFGIAEEPFLDRYIHAYKEEAPGLLQLYRDKLHLSAQHGKL